MGTFTTGVGLLSGLPIQDMIDQLIAIEARPRDLAQGRLAAIQTQRTAFLDINARLLAIKNALGQLSTSEAFRAFTAASSDSSILTATAGANAAPGSFAFVVKSLVSNHQLVSRGLADAEAPGLGTGTVTVEVGNGFVNRATRLDELNGFEGVQRGQIKITDRAGASATVDLSTAVTVRDAIEAINEAGDIQVTAAVSGDRLVLTDNSGGAGSLVVQEVAGGRAAQDLGILGAALTDPDVLTGVDIRGLADGTRLSLLNDNTGVGRARGQADFRILVGEGPFGFDVALDDTLIRGNASTPETGTRLAQLNHGSGLGAALGTIRITDRAGNSTEIDLSTVDRGLDANGLNQTTVQDVLNEINNRLDEAGVNVEVEIGSLGALRVTDTTPNADTMSDDVRQNLKIEDVEGATAGGLGILIDAEGTSEELVVKGDRVFFVDTVGDALRAINYHEDNPTGAEHVTASVSGNGISLAAAAGVAEVVALNSSTAADDLGLTHPRSVGATALQSRDLIAGLNTVLLSSLRGGRGVAGQLTIEGADGTFTADLSGLQTLHEVIELLNGQTATTGIAARVNSAGNGLEVYDTSENSSALQISGQAAVDLGLIADPAGETIAAAHVTANAQLRYLAHGTHLATLNGGSGVTPGKFRITNSNGVTAVVDLTQGNEVTLRDVIEEINSRFTGDQQVLARINDNGDGLIIEDLAGGPGQLKIEEDGGTTARDLNILGEAQSSEAGENFIDGALEVHVEVTASDTLNSLAAKLNDASGGRYSAHVINDGSGTNAYRLSLTSRVGGSIGELSFDTRQIDLETDTLIEARDARVLLGGQSQTNNILITSSSNTLRDVVPGLTINLLGRSDDPVTISVDKDVEGIVESARTFVSAFNAALNRMGELTAYDAETGTRGVLFADSAVSTIRSRLTNRMMSVFEGASEELQYLSEVGISVGYGGQLSLDEDRFREVLAENPEAVEDLFTSSDSGFADRLEETLDELTRDYDGYLAVRDRTLESREDLLNDRIEFLNDQLAQKRRQLNAQFLAMERALAALQGQQSALSALSSLLDTA